MGHSHSSSRTPPRACTDPPALCRRWQRSLPPELLLFIFEEAFCAAPDAARRAGLRAAALVCRAWRLPAQQLLWRAIDLRRRAQLAALRDACRTSPRGPALAACARTLTVWNPVGDPSYPPPTVRDIAKLLRSLPRLAELRLDRPAPPFAPAAAGDLHGAAVRRPPVPPLTALRISYAHPALVHALLRALPALRFVEVRGCRADAPAPDPAPPPPPPPRCKLYELRWGCDSHLHVPHALRTSQDSLRILALHSLPPAAALPRHLRSLRVFRYDPTLLPAVRRCAALEEFVMQDHVPPAALLAALPHSLEHLALDCDDGNQCGLAAVAAWLRAGAHARLRVLTCFSPDVRDADWPDFVRACRSARVELRCFKGWHGFYGNESEALGEVARFPRAVPQHAQRILVVGPSD